MESPLHNTIKVHFSSRTQSVPSARCSRTLIARCEDSRVKNCHLSKRTLSATRSESLIRISVNIRSSDKRKFPFSSTFEVEKYEHRKKILFLHQIFCFFSQLVFFLLRSRQFNLLSLWIKCCLLLSRVVSYVLNIFTFFPLRFLDPQRSAQKPEWGGMRNASLLVFSLFFLLKSSNNDNKWYSYMEKAFLWRSWARSFDDSMGGRRNEMRFEGLFLILVINTRRHFLFLFFFNFAMAFLAFLFTIV